jgi:hypothetical protein
MLTHPRGRLEGFLRSAYRHRHEGPQVGLHDPGDLRSRHDCESALLPPCGLNKPLSTLCALALLHLCTSAPLRGVMLTALGVRLRGRRL